MEDTIIVYKKPIDIYSISYAKIYDKLVSFKKNTILYQCDDFVDYGNVDTMKKEDIQIVDIGCGTGNHIYEIGKTYPITGLDISEPMLHIAKSKVESMPLTRLIHGDMMDARVLRTNYYSHITFFYFSFYYATDISKLLENCYRWLKPKGYLVVELVDRDKFDPILEAANPFPLLSLQNYSDHRITQSEIFFNNMTYVSNFKVQDAKTCIFEEMMTYSEKKTIKNIHTLSMPPLSDVVHEIKRHHFELLRITNLANINYNYHYLFYFRKMDIKN